MWDPLWGKRDYCASVCEQCLKINSVQILPLPWTLALGWGKSALKSAAYKLHLLCHLRFASCSLVDCKSRKHEACQRLWALKRTLLLEGESQDSGKLTLLSCAILFEWARLCLRIVIWLILPVVICLSQRLSHARLSISVIQWNCEWLIKTVIASLIIEFTWITVVILELIHAGLPDFWKGCIY